MNLESIKMLVMLQVFIDSGLGKRNEPISPEIDNSVEFLKGLPVKGRCLKSWFLRMAIDKTPEYIRISEALRRMEAYSMVSFLLQEGGSGEKLQSLSARYGVSTCHFRRLFRSGLGSSPKSSLKDWQLAKAVLAVIEDRQTITEAAMLHGYASSSHFSNAVRQSLGLSLTHLFDNSTDKKDLM
ncbi:helix-turn-helix domain-containing protein [Glaciimonas immobilis]|uniref:AraC-like DNA-binding protein n=1 Tax=Glaciimonas immobilis TaxID=728004 RepID=A0A840RPD0_9BURK|nr:helix-turn-helix domain-containing protein [Glaciimonas immobilis]KAF3999326.1 helix-turn-helix domain-containing protein [Glaciimonas immobilis]MBB5198808.1 AraC-like DNA-binding protein [Glaciimonas immobilis]